jgi:hypothetical protein
MPLWKQITRVYSCHHVEFPSDYSLDASVLRLTAQSQSKIRLIPQTNQPAGHVSSDTVFLYRPSSPWAQNSFRPVFYGRFQTKGDSTTLVGTFSHSNTAKSIVTFAYVLSATISGTCLLLLSLGSPGNSPLRLMGGIIVACGTAFLFAGMVAFGEWLASDDIEWLSRHIRQALTKDNRIGNEVRPNQNKQEDGAK